MVPELITEFVSTMKNALKTLTDDKNLALEVKANFLRHARHTFGRTALVLSGGGALGCFHIVRIPASCIPLAVLPLPSYFLVDAILSQPHPMNRSLSRRLTIGYLIASRTLAHGSCLHPRRWTEAWK